MKNYWVPENFLFSSAGLCLDICPEEGAAVHVTTVLPGIITISRGEFHERLNCVDGGDITLTVDDIEFIEACFFGPLVSRGEK